MDSEAFDNTMSSGLRNPLFLTVGGMDCHRRSSAIIRGECLVGMIRPFHAERLICCSRKTVDG